MGAQGRQQLPIAFRRDFSKSGAASLDELMEMRNAKGYLLHQAFPPPPDPPS